MLYVVVYMKLHGSRAHATLHQVDREYMYGLIVKRSIARFAI